MSRRVFISFLGTNNYIECKYRDGDYVSPPVRFIQEALLRNICGHWTSDDRVLIFCTEEAERKNWLDNGQERATSEVERQGLQQRLALFAAEPDGLKVPVEMVHIAEGFTEDDVWRIFSVVYEKLEPQDEIYFDVTHAFRSIPIFSVVLFNYARFMKDTRIMAVKYGAFEQLGPAFQVKDIPVEERVAPVLDLTNIVRLQEYNQIASNLKDFGKVKSLKSVLAYVGEIPADGVIRDLSNSIAEMDEYITTIDLKKIKSGNFIKKFRDSYKFVTRKRTMLAPIMNILHELYRETQDFVPEDSFRNIEAAVNWTIKHDMLMQAYPLAEEYIIRWTATKYAEERPSALNPKKYHIFISSLLGMPQEDFRMRQWKETLALYPDVANVLADEPFIIRLRPLYDKVRNMRNSLAHGNGSVTYRQLQQGIVDIVQCLTYLNPEYKNYQSTQELPSF